MSDYVSVRFHGADGVTEDRPVLAARSVYGERGVQVVDRFRWSPGMLAALRLRSARRLAAGPSWATVRGA